jgi:drug/metabolite transporter (DMT)-like permease
MCMRLAFTRLDAWLLGMVFIWGSNFTIIKAALREFPELGFNALRMVTASALFALILAHRQQLWAGRGFTRHDWLRILLLAVVGHFLYQLLFLGGVARTSVANSSLIFGCTPVTVALLSAWLGHERVSLVRWAGAALSLSGVYLVVAGGSQRGASLTGDMLVAVAMFSWALYTVGSRSLLARHSPLVVTGYTMAIGSLLYAPFGVPSLVRLDWAAISVAGWLGLLYSAVFALVVSYLIWYTAVQRVGNSRTSIYSNVVPLVAISVAALVLGESIALRQILGAAAILGGVAVTRLEFGVVEAQGPAES